MTKLIRSFVVNSTEEEDVLKELLRLNQADTTVSVRFNYQIQDSYFGDGTWYRVLKIVIKHSIASAMLLKNY